MKILTAIINTILGMVFVAFCSIVATFFIAIFNAEGVVRAIEIIRNLLPM